MSTDLEERLLRRLIEAEEKGTPLTHRQLGMEVHGSTFEDLWANMRVVIKGKERSICCVASPDSEYIASEYGKWWLAKQEAERAGKPAPPAPPERTVFLF